MSRHGIHDKLAMPLPYSTLSRSLDEALVYTLSDFGPDVRALILFFLTPTRLILLRSAKPTEHIMSYVRNANMITKTNRSLRRLCSQMVQEWSQVVPHKAANQNLPEHVRCVGVSMGG